MNFDVHWAITCNGLHRARVQMRMQLVDGSVDEQIFLLDEGTVEEALAIVAVFANELAKSWHHQHRELS